MTKSLFHVRMKYTRSIEEAKEMKKWLAVFTCGLLLSAGVCMSQAEGAGEDTLYEKGKEIAELVIDAVRSEDYVNLYSASVFCKTFLHKIAKTFCRSLQLHFVGNCKPGWQSWYLPAI